MPSTELCIELASQRIKKWDQYDDATRAAEAILQDCLDRRGIKQEFRACDQEVLSEIVASWADIIRAVSNRQPKADPKTEARRP